MSLRISYIEEPKLMFSRGESYNPTVGLIKYGPRFSTVDETEHKWLKVGIIGSGQSLSLTSNLLEDMRHPAIPDRITRWNIPFPGLSEKSPLKFSLSYRPEWQQKVSVTETGKVLSEKTREKKAESFLELVDEKLEVIYGKNPPPDVVFVNIPKEIENECKDPKYDKPLLKLPNRDDFHNRLKLYGMKYKIPTQLIRPDTLSFKGTQEKSIVFWNLAVAMLYKSQKGYPWKLARLEENTCYVGISFFKERDAGQEYTRASMAQVFLDTGESFILRGDPFEWRNEQFPKSPHLSQEGAEELIKRVLKQYKSVRGNLPERLVLHKSSNYWDEELEGFLNASDEISSRDFVTISDTNRRFYRSGEYGVLRGTLISTQNMDEHYLYTTGFVPCINTYPGLGVPIPVLIRCITHDSDIRKICQEILAFTKLDWNNAFIYRKYPVTIWVSRKVGGVLSETIAKKIEYLDPHYYYYM